MFKKLRRYLEKIQCPKLRYKNNHRLSNTILQSSSLTETRSFNAFSNTHKRGDVTTNTCSKKAKNIGPRAPNAELRVPNVFSKKIGPHQSSDFQSKEFEPLRGPVQIQAAQCSTSAGFLTRRRLGCENRHNTGIFSCPSGSVSPAIPESTVQNSETLERPPRIASNNLATLRAVIITQGVRNSIQLDCPALAQKRHEDSCLFRRLPDSEPGFPHLGGPSCRSCSCPDLTGFYSKFSKVRAHTMQGSGLSWCNLESRFECQISAERKNPKNREHSSIDFELQSMDGQRCAKDSRYAEFCCIRRTQRSTSLPPHTNGSLFASQRPASPKVFTRSNSHERNALVAPSAKDQDSDPHTSCRSLLDDRCISHRMGCCFRRSCMQRQLVPRSDFLAQQLEGNVGRNSNDTRLPSHLTEVHNIASDRQQERRMLHKEGRWPQIKGPVLFDSNPVPVAGRERHSNSTTIYSGSVQRPSRSSVTTEIPRRVVSVTGRLSRDLQAVRDTNNRLIRLEQRTRACTLRLSRLQRHERRISRRIQQNLEISQSMGVSAPPPRTTSAGSPQQGQGQIHISSPSVAQSILASGSQEEGSAVPVYHNQPTDEIERHSDSTTTSPCRSDVSRSMVSKGWRQHLTGWSHNEVELLDSSWRPSTKKVYASIWSKWQEWCKNNSVADDSPSGAQLAKYLAHLHLQSGLSYKTILVYKSTIATMSNPESSSLSDNPIVKRMLKSISVANSGRNHTKPAVWDPRIVVEWLAKNVLETRTLYEISRRTALILLLASSRRIHDLTLLQIDSDHYEDHGDHLILHPVFGSKTDNYVHRQSSWKFTRADNESICPVHWVKSLVEISKDRRASSDVTALFITARGAAGAASRTVLGGWVRSLLRAAGVHASAGSTRSAAASLNWLDNCSIDEVMAKGNWQTPNTFARFYSAEIRQMANGNANLSRSFHVA